LKNKNYMQFLTKEYLMGPNSLGLLEELLELLPAEARTGRILDLGCGMAATSLFLAREAKADTVFAADLWITPSDNLRRIRQWGENRRIIPLHCDAADMPFADGYLDLIVSVDAYHYFGCEDGFFGQKIYPLLAEGGRVLIAVPGIKEEYAADIPPLLAEWAQEDARFFHSQSWWAEHLARGTQGITFTLKESERFDSHWQDWFDSGHEYAANDLEYFRRGLGNMLCFVLIMAEKTI